jgi:hypothetical protein
LAQRKIERWRKAGRLCSSQDRGFSEGVSEKIEKATQGKALTDDRIAVADQESAGRNRQGGVPVCVDLELMRVLHAIKMTNKNPLGNNGLLPRTNPSLAGASVDAAT